MQLQYAHVLQQLLPLVCFNADESFKIDLEDGVQLDDRRFEIDLLLTGLVKGKACSSNTVPRSGS